MDLANEIPIVLLLLFAFATTAGTAMVVLVIRSGKLQPRLMASFQARHLASAFPEAHGAGFLPPSWLVVKSGNLDAVQSALGLRHVKPCSWLEGLEGEQQLFLAPPVNGWVLIFGPGLPDPSDDVDLCFRFLVKLSRKIGPVQFFTAHRVLYHHAWVRAEAGRIVRAYAWAGTTLWNQGQRTSAERELDLHCFDYVEPERDSRFEVADVIAANVDRVSLLAAKWSLDPAGIDDQFLAHACGIAGEPTSRY